MEVEGHPIGARVGLFIEEAVDVQIVLFQDLGELVDEASPQFEEYLGGNQAV